jgi:hypothetical protein
VTGVRRFKSVLPDQFKSVALLVGGLLWQAAEKLILAAEGEPQALKRGWYPRTWRRE